METVYGLSRMVQRYAKSCGMEKDAVENAVDIVDDMRRNYVIDISNLESYALGIVNFTLENYLLRKRSAYLERVASEKNVDLDLATDFIHFYKVRREQVPRVKSVWESSIDLFRTA